jgi:hypothetical protein
MPIGFRRTAVAMAVAAGVAGAGEAGDRAFPDFERDGPVALLPQSSSDPCVFFRGQAFDKALSDYTREMLWACEEIARRRAARIPLGDRLEATAAMLDAYREAIIAAGSEAFVRNRRAGLPPWALGLSDDEKYAIADATGALLALEAIRLGF